MKKIILGVATSATTLGTIATALSCSGKETGNIPALKGYSSITVSNAGFTSQKRPTTATQMTFTKDKVAFVSDGNKLDDNGFNQTIIEGFQAARGVTGSTILTDHIFNSSSKNDIKTKYEEAIKTNDLILVAGFEHLNILGPFAKAHQDKRFILIDGHLTTETAKELPWNVRSIEFGVAAPSFIMGVLAASKAQEIDPVDPVVGVYGGMEIKTVTAYLNAFKNGIAYFDEKLMAKGSKPVLIDDQKFAGNFGSSPESIKKAELLATNGSDIILSVGGSEYLDTLAQIQRIKNGKAKIIGVDTIIGKVEISGPVGKDFVFGSILKNLSDVTQKVIADFIAKGKPEDFGKLYIADMTKNGTGLSIAGQQYKGKDSIIQEMGVLLGKSISTKQIEDIYNYAVNTK